MNTRQRSKYSKSSQSSSKFYPKISNTPDLPAIDFGKVGQSAPKVLPIESEDLPQADVVLICWAEAEWAATQQVFVNNQQTMPYSDASKNYWTGWQKYDQDLPSYDGWYYWGYFFLVEISGLKVLLWKSNTHLDWPGEDYLADMIQMLIDKCQPSLILSTGTAGGARLEDHEGTVLIVDAATLYEEDEEPSSWPTFATDWQPVMSLVDNANFGQLLFPIPVTSEDLSSVAVQFNDFYGTNYPLSELNALDLDYGDPQPKIYDLTPNTTLLTTSTFVVANTSGNYANYACVEMDDAIIAEVCEENGIGYGSVRNVSDPVQNADLPESIQADWGSAIYDAYGFYTSFNGALAAWAVLAAQGKSSED